MRSQSPGLAATLMLSVITCICAFHTATAIDIPLEVLGHVNIEQLPTITDQAPSTLIALPFDESFPMTCEAKGNPEPEFQWKKNGEDFDPYLDPRLIKEENSGTFVIPNNGNLTEYQGIYRCYASNKLGTAISKDIEFIVPNVPKFPKENLEPLEVEEGQPFVLKCDPPSGIPPLQIYWMTINLQHIEQDERVSTGLNGDLYFSHAVEKDSRRDYCCFAAFSKIRTIVQKNAMSVKVKTRKGDSANAILERKPSLLTPPGDRSEKQLVKGENLELECIPEGIPTPQVEWMKVGGQLPVKAKLENHKKLLIVPRAEQEDSGKYMCRAKNLLGEAIHYFTVTVEGPPEWVSEPESQLSMIGSDVHIKCSASGVPEPTITWRVNGELLLESPAPNRKLLGDTIILHNAKASDSAVYQCEASNRHGTLLSNANIMIMNLQPMILTNNGEDYSTVEGKGVIMHCKVFSSPPSTITWSKDDLSESVDGPRFTVHNNGSLEINSVEESDAGQYTCLAKNTEGSSAIDAMLYIKDPTRIVLAPEDLQILKGTTARLSCLAEYDKSFSNDFELLWEKDNTEIALNYTEDSSRYILEDSNLHIVNVSHSDQGVYRCVAKTPLDRDTASASLKVLDVPDAPENLVLSELKSKSVKLKWIPGDDHNSPPTEFIVEYEENKWEPGNWKELLRVPGNHNSAVLKLHGHIEYRFRVYAVSDVGAGPPSAPTERYKTPPSAPDKNPENIKIEGRLPHEMDINWEPLMPIEHNGPGLEYKVSYRRQDVEEDWKEHTVKRHSFVVWNTPTFVPYEVKIQAKNNQGWGPEPRIVSGYSGEDFPSAAPDDVAVEVMNSSAVKVTWTRVHKDKLHGHLGGYRINWWRLRSLVDSKKSHGDKHSLTFPGDRTHATVPGLTPFSEYSLIVMTFNGRGNGPGSHPVNFKTPEGVPEKNSDFRVTDVKRESVSLAWGPPIEPNGILTGYLLEYQLINDTEEVGALQAVDINNPDTTKWILRELEPLSKYKFYLRSCTAVGCGPVVSEESITKLQSTSFSAPTVGIRKSLSTTSTPRSHVTKPTRSSIGLASIHGGISTQGWFIGLMCAIALLTLIVLIACFVNRNKGGKYSVKEKEDLHPDVESQGMNDDTFCEYSDNDEKPLKGSQRSLSREIKAADSGDSLVDYGDEDVQFNEDGSFIGEYGSRKEKRASTEIKAPTQTTA
ncbi:PREDICTED: neural cell adhesion molecule L1-like protein isoform X1 [Cyprinodon variegatus]|uniref:Neural cell adhesion molecule L1-like protein n=1 Tax=Cyprinodon variegatus TaxID=28743 RepID=A0A3Q2EFS6_CYPVA|nr:PREDICTED: neural cell adhesion molecule L1-like protein isoform X1 [Cyprinodon variegatus]XP_015226469.1 PREDICTED: neural cell adhesion molecule L1-like protein isoform X1 [Cyprinodon variegatus]XP_015226470.1 PREDICTED: neural cell adhesion molecule L1-like protein isoform X1 [Cyprinodon variegatus]